MTRKMERGEERWSRRNRTRWRREESIGIIIASLSAGVLVFDHQLGTHRVQQWRDAIAGGDCSP